MTRLYTRVARTRGWGSGHAGDIHVHHLVVGIIFILTSGWAALALDPGAPWVEILGIFFGVGSALTLDEFALWLYLKDVYWMEEGRASIDAVILAFMLGTVVALGMTPVGIDESAGADVIAISVTLAVIAAVISILKGKFYMGIIGLFIPVLAYVAAVPAGAAAVDLGALALHGEQQKMAKALTRDVKRQARKTRVRDFLGGTPHLKSPQA